MLTAQPGEDGYAAQKHGADQCRIQNLWSVLLEASTAEAQHSDRDRSLARLEEERISDCFVDALYEEFLFWRDLSLSSPMRGVQSKAARHADELRRQLHRWFPRALDELPAGVAFPRHIELPYAKRRLDLGLEIYLPIPVTTWNDIAEGGSGVSESLAMGLIWGLARWLRSLGCHSQFTCTATEVRLVLECGEERLAGKSDFTVELGEGANPVAVRLVPLRPESGEGCAE